MCVCVRVCGRVMGGLRGGVPMMLASVVAFALAVLLTHTMPEVCFSFGVLVLAAGVVAAVVTVVKNWRFTGPLGSRGASLGATSGLGSRSHSLPTRKSS